MFKNICRVAVLSFACLLIFFGAPSRFAFANVTACHQIFGSGGEARSTAEVARGLESGAKLKLPPGNKMFARVLRQQAGTQFSRLTDDPLRKIVMVMDGAGIESISGNAKTEILLKIGYKQDYLKYLFENGYTFKIAIFDGANMAKAATWNVLGEMLSQKYSDVVSQLFLKYREQLTSLKFSEVQGNLSFKVNYELGPKNPQYLTAEKLTSSSSLWEFRAFLYNDLRLTELYTGKGYTELENGERGVPEYFIMDQDVVDLPEIEMVDLK